MKRSGRTSRSFSFNLKQETMDITAHEWHIIANPTLLNGHRAETAKAILTELGNRNISHTLHAADGGEWSGQTAERLCREGQRHLMMVGGDGSINNVINGIYQSGVDTEEVHLAIIPLGTGNDFCRTLGYPKAEGFVNFLQDGEFRPTDVGIVETVVNGAVTARRRFINIAGFAFDAAVINETVHGKPKLFPDAVYLLKLVKVLFSYKATRVTVTTEAGSYSDKLFTIACGNAQYNGNGMRQVPMANPHDGLLDLVTIRKIRPLKVVANVKNLFSGKHINLPEVKVTRTSYVELTSDQPLLGEVEGEMLATGNYRIRMEEKRINILQAK